MVVEVASGSESVEVMEVKADATVLAAVVVDLAPVGTELVGAALQVVVLAAAVQSVASWHGSLLAWQQYQHHYCCHYHHSHLRMVAVHLAWQLAVLLVSSWFTT